MIGSNTSGTANSTSAVILKLVSAIISRPPIAVTVERSAIEKLEPTTLCSKVVSAVKREITSPVRIWL